jgi:phospholipase/carboxylesterase
MNLSSVSVSVDLPLSFLRKFEGNEKPLLVLFHGFTDSAQAFLRRAYPEASSDYEVLAINGLFPSPVRIEGGWKRAYSWYFADYETNSIVIHPEVAAGAINQLLEMLGLQDREKVLVGFSQGGFFLPHVFKKITKVRKMIGIGSAYRLENYPEEVLSIPLDAIHGTEDSVVPFAHGQESFEKLKVKNPLGHFHAIQGLKHTMNDEARALLKSLLVK